MRAYERLIRYAMVHTACDEYAAKTPSTERQFDLARMLEAEMKALGVQDVFVDEHCYVYGKIPATPGLENKTALGFLAHLDTVPNFSGENVKPRLVEDYDGGWAGSNYYENEYGVYDFDEEDLLLLALLDDSVF